MVSDTKQTDIHTHTKGPPEPEPSAFDVELVTEKIKRHILPGFDLIPSRLD
jgi:hypothetical protein